ncbi:uncharacterized protein LOC124494770 isoform X1 [Dermatophagoides farinae]|uniref:uncharacterized protein LOC124494770 isoform X1 n=1 Tax=Dermatophagoides farinae TaxID=6954 RepID=UPI003F6331FF
MGSKNSKCESEENADNKNLMKLDSISTVSMAFTANDGGGTDDGIDGVKPPLCSCQSQRHMQQQQQQQQKQQSFSNQTDVYENKSIVQQQSDRPKSSLPASRNSFVLDMDDDNHIHHVRHQQHHHKSANIDHGDYGFPTLDSIHSTIEKNHGGHSPNSAAAAASVNRKSITRKSSSIMLITLFDTLILMMMLALAIILRFTDEIKPIETWFSKRLVCMFPELYSWPFKVVSNTEGVLLFDKLSSTEFLFFLFVFIIPIAAIIFLELNRLLIRQIVHGDHDDHGESIIVPKINLSIPLSVRRTCRILAGFILGLTACSIIADFVKLQTGQYRPFILDICPDFCHGKIVNSNITCWNNNSIADDQRIDVRKSMPSIVATLSSYTAIFLVYYTTAALNYRATKLFRLSLSVAIIVIGVLLSMSRVTTYRNHLWDVWAGWLIGWPLAYYIVWYHLNGFSNRLSISNLFSAKYQCRCNRNNVQDSSMMTSSINWLPFHIPRVQTSAKTANENVSRIPSYLKSNSGQVKQSPTTHSNAYINPAFSADDNNPDNHYHYHSSRIILDSNNNQMVKRDGHHQKRRSQMRTFAN